MNPQQSTDRIERNIVIKAPRKRVWRALTDPAEFGKWFGVKVEGTFAPGARVQGQITHPDYTHVRWDVTIDRMEPETFFSWRWHPYGVDKGVDYSHEIPTLVEFRLADVPEGTRLEVVESGFDSVPLARRALAYRMNSGGWEKQLENVKRHAESQ
jgi:uncharacterized protein YndB with AHSA1/START domain